MRVAGQATDERGWCFVQPLLRFARLGLLASWPVAAPKPQKPDPVRIVARPALANRRGGGRHFRIKWMGIAALSFTLGLSTRADFVFKNSTTNLEFVSTPAHLEVGNQITLTHVGYVTNFSFEYWAVGGAYGGAAFSGTFVQARVRWYLNDGPTITQGALSVQRARHAVEGLRMDGHRLPYRRLDPHF